MNTASRHHKLLFRGILGAAIILLLVAGVALVGTITELTNTQRGIREGFDLTGTYAAPDQVPGMVPTIAFDARESTNTWEVSGGAHDRIKGTLVKTHDPNFYHLANSDGEEVGWVHLAYANTKGEGTLYIQGKTNDIVELEKYDKLPVLFINN